MRGVCCAELKRAWAVCIGGEVVEAHGTICGPDVLQCDRRDDRIVAEFETPDPWLGIERALTTVVDSDRTFDCSQTISG